MGKHHKQDRYIVVNNNNVLIDGYVQYLVLKENNISEALVKRSNVSNKSLRRINYEKSTYRNESTTYIYGIHEKSNSPKVYVWRVPKKWHGWTDNLEIGNSILVGTKYGCTKVKVVGIKCLDKCPVEFNVNRVCNKKIIK